MEIKLSRNQTCADTTLRFILLHSRAGNLFLLPGAGSRIARARIDGQVARQMKTGEYYQAELGASIFTRARNRDLTAPLVCANAQLLSRCRHERERVSPVNVNCGPIITAECALSK